MTPRQRSALVRLLVLAAAWAAGETVMRQLGMPGPATLVGAALAAAAFMATRNVALGKRGGGDVIYWRGRRIDRDRLH